MNTTELKRQPQVTKSIMLGSMTLEQLLTILCSERDKLTALIHSNLSAANEELNRWEINNGIQVIVTEINCRLEPFKARIAFDESGTQHVDKFFFAFNNPLDYIPVSQIKACKLLGIYIYFEIIDSDGKATQRKAMDNAYIRNQIEQFNLHLEVTGS